MQYLKHEKILSKVKSNNQIYRPLRKGTAHNTLAITLYMGVTTFLKKASSSPP
jgi:hypothetical protein